MMTDTDGEVVRSLYLPKDYLGIDIDSPALGVGHGKR